MRGPEFNPSTTRCKAQDASLAFLPATWDFIGLGTHALLYSTPQSQAEEAMATYRTCVADAKTQKQELEDTKVTVLRQIQEVIRQSDQTIKSVRMFGGDDGLGQCGQEEAQKAPVRMRSSRVGQAVITGWAEHPHWGGASVSGRSVQGSVGGANGE